MPTKRPHDTNAEPPSRNLGAPRVPTSPGRYVTGGGITVDSSVTPLGDQRAEIDALVSRLDSERGCMFESSYEFPGRYARWTMGFVNPPLCFEASGRTFAIEALNARGEVLVAPVHEALSRCDAVEAISLSQTEAGAAVLRGSVKPPAAGFAEEQRSRQHSIFSLVRALRDLFSCEAEPMLGLYGAFGYDLTFQFEPIRPAQSRVAGARDLLLYLPDELLVVDIHTRGAWRLTYDFTVGGRSSASLPRSGLALPYVPLPEEQLPFRRDHAAGAFASKVARAKKEFEVGNLFEVVLSQNFAEPCPDPPSAIFRRLRSRNPSPYGFLINLGPDRGVDGGGDGGGQPEYLVGASPEMFVRVERDARGWRCETCPISGTIRRGADAMEDAKNIQTILADKKEESELTMCTDVDRNDKSRICEAGSVTVIGRRQIEMYSRLIHTVDHVEGYLRDGFDAMDAFLAHTWAVTVTGAPKPWAIQFVEDHEESPRHWYGGAVGCIGFDGCLNTGLTLRTVRIAGGFAQVRAGATLLYDSEPAAEEKETELKASAMRDAVLRPDPPPASLARIPAAASSSARVVLVDHQDSFVHTLANYLRQTGALVTTLRFGFEPAQLDALQPTLAVLSPGPGKPADFDLSRTIELMLGRKVPLFGVCLGLQGMVEHFGGSLGVLSYPQHGKPGSVRLTAAPGDIFAGCPAEFQVGRYHSLYSQRESHPACLRITAETTDGVIMGIQHAELPLAAVQFHPESILTRSDLGVQMLVNAANKLRF